jgi:hypothetical protein
VAGVLVVARVFTVVVVTRTSFVDCAAVVRRSHICLVAVVSVIRRLYDAGMRG